jgi:alkylation response protein AidB-like acyl-CoA dehydrogenase
MKLILTEEQQFLKDTAQSFARDKTPVTHFREMRDSENAQCWDETVWKEMVELGWSGFLFLKNLVVQNLGWLVSV